ncbi:cell division protein ZapA [Pseudotabrizicola sediminis]|uniref:Cell division protein ZapA n=1 Tax=Pseudotabrizicola sediminis TaxID=2486418 RepID=A0ABY2KV09_9RHOB|nr:cell division protein ZapA [Pseudotabrizicola sediminis]TGD45029.1 cell division protein ZapA [Pseudotabrizicola sediminis]
MPDVTVLIGGREFQVACQAGEEHFLQSAAALLNAEADPLVQQMGRMPEARMLLMSGLMLADKTAALEDENRQLKERLAVLQAQPAAPVEKVEVPVIPPQVFETLAEIAARAEALADRIEERAEG